MSTTSDGNVINCRVTVTFCMSILSIVALSNGRFIEWQRDLTISYQDDVFQIKFNYKLALSLTLAPGLINRRCEFERSLGFFSVSV